MKTRSMHRETGMTLVEVMISTVVLSMVMLALAASLRTFATTYSSVERAAEKTARLREVTQFLRLSLREAYQPHNGAFFVSANQISWLAPLDRAGVAGGVRWLRLRKAGEALMLDLAIPDDDSAEKAASDPDWGAVIPSEVLLEGLRGFEVRRLDDPDQEQLVGDGESSGDLMPSGIRLDMELIDGNWPPVIVALDGFGLRE